MSLNESFSFNLSSLVGHFSFLYFSQCFDLSFRLFCLLWPVLFSSQLNSAHVFFTLVGPYSFLISFSVLLTTFLLSSSLLVGQSPHLFSPLICLFSRLFLTGLTFGQSSLLFWLANYLLCLLLSLTSLLHSSCLSGLDFGSSLCVCVCVKKIILALDVWMCVCA